MVSQSVALWTFRFTVNFATRGNQERKVRQNHFFLIDSFTEVAKENIKKKILCH